MTRQTYGRPKRRVRQTFKVIVFKDEEFFSFVGRRGSMNVKFTNEYIEAIIYTNASENIVKSFTT